jgi:16S rRNA (guanine966-N2)-methyltransferase
MPLPISFARHVAQSYHLQWSCSVSPLGAGTILTEASIARRQLEGGTATHSLTHSLSLIMSRATRMVATTLVLLLLVVLDVRQASAFALPIAVGGRLSPQRGPLQIAAGGSEGGGGGAAREGAQKRRRKPRGKDLERDAQGLPSEKVYAPRAPKSARFTMGGGGRKFVRPQGEEREEGINNANRLRVLGGSAKGRRLTSPDVYMRPMMGKVKEALFSSLVSLGALGEGECRFLDLFCGSGSVGIEALSRGASHATFVDLAQDCLAAAETNARITGLDSPGATAYVRGDVMDVLYNPAKFGLLQPYDVITITPPYEEVVYGDLIRAVAESELTAEDSIVVLEYPVELGCLPHVIADGALIGLRNRRYGRTVMGVYMYRPSGRFRDADSRPEEFIMLGKQKY